MKSGKYLGLRTLFSRLETRRNSQDGFSLELHHQPTYHPGAE